MIYFCLFFIPLITFILIRKIILLKILNKYKENILKLGYFFNKEFSNNYIEYYYNSSLIFIYLNNLKKLNKLFLFFNINKIEEILEKDLEKILYIYYTKDYRIDYFLEDMKITKNKSILFKELKIKFLLIILNSNLKKELNNLKFNDIKHNILIK